jgi:hypothetical protein
MGPVLRLGLRGEKCGSCSKMPAEDGSVDEKEAAVEKESRV